MPHFPLHVMKLKTIKNLRTEFKRQYDRGDLPLYIALSKTKRRLAWKVNNGCKNSQL
jgi:hypothetical protein